MKIEKCLKCGFEWMSRVEKPKQCPRCKQYGWNKNLDEQEVKGGEA